MFSFVFLLLVLTYCSEADIQLSGSVMIVRQVKSLKCSSEVNLSRYPGLMVAYHQWNQVYPGESDRFISNLRAIEALSTIYTVELQKFDNNTNIYSLFSVYNASNEFQDVFNLTVHCSGFQRKLISLVDDDFYRYQVDQIFTYAGSSVKFSCLQYLRLSDNIQIGWINTAGDRIFTYNQSEIIMNLAEVHNGSMLCCLYYTTSAYKSRLMNGKHIQRFVTDKTLLIYQKEMPNNGSQRNDTTTESYCENTSNRNITETVTTTQFITDTSKATGKNSTTIKETSKTTCTINEVGKNTCPTNEVGKNTGTTSEVGKNTGTTNEVGKNTGNINEVGKNTCATNEVGKNTNETGQTQGTANETGKNTGITNETGKITGITNETGKNTGITNKTGINSDSANETDKNTGTTNRTDLSDHDADTTDDVIIIISTISAIMLLLLGICAIKKRCWKKTNRPVRAQLPLPQIPGARLRPPNEPDSHAPFYLNLLFRRECEREIQAQEDPLYEEIIYQ